MGTPPHPPAGSYTLLHKVMSTLEDAAKRGAEGTLFHHEADQLCIWHPSKQHPVSIRNRLGECQMRLVWFVNGPFGQSGHNYFHLAGVLPTVLHDEVEYQEQQYYVEDLVGEQQQALTRAAVFAVGGLAIRVPPEIKSVLANLLSLQLGGKECLRQGTRIRSDKARVR